MLNFSPQNQSQKFHATKRLVFRRKKTAASFSSNPDFASELENYLASKKEEKGEEISLSKEVSRAVNQKISSVILANQYLDQYIADFSSRNKTISEKELVEFGGRLDSMFEQITNNYNELSSLETNINELFAQLIDGGAISETEQLFLQNKLNEKALFRFVDSMPKLQPRATHRLDPANLNDLKNTRDPAAYEALLNSLLTSDKILPDWHDELALLGPKTDQQAEQFRSNIYNAIEQYDQYKNTQTLKTLGNLIGRRDRAVEVIDESISTYNTITSEITHKINEYYQTAKGKAEQMFRVEQLSREVGLPLKEGQILYAEDWGKNLRDPAAPHPRTIKVTIEKITFDNPEMSDDPDILNNFPSHEPIIHLIFENLDGSNQEKARWIAGDFRRYVSSNKVSENFTDKDQLEKALNIEGKIKSGESFEFTQITKNEEGNSKTSQITFKIEKVENGKIFIDREVIVEAPNPYNKNVLPQQAKEFTFSEFAIWFRQVEVSPKITDLQELNQKLAKFAAEMRKEYKLEDQQFPPVKLDASALPIVLVSNTENPDYFTYTAIDKNGLTDKNGNKETFNEFYNNAKRRFLTPGSPEERAKQLEAILPAPGDKKAVEAEKAADIQKQISLSDQKSAAPARASGPFRWAKAKFWDNVRFLNFMQIKELLKAGTDRFFAELKERRDNATNEIGAKLYNGVPFIGQLSDDYKNKVNSGKMKRIKDRVTWLNDNANVPQVFDFLYAAQDEIELRACLEFLANKGVLREDDEKLHEVLNRLVPATYYKASGTIPKEFHGKRILIDKNLAKKIPLLEQIRLLMDQGYFVGAYRNYFGTNEDKYNSQVSSTASKFRDYEWNAEGIKKEIWKRMLAFQKDEPVDAAEFDGMIRGAIADEVNMTEGLMMFLAAWGMRNSSGKSILPDSRMHPYIGTLKNNPAYFFFAMKFPRRDENGNIIMGPDGKPEKDHLRKNELAYFFREYALPDINANISKMGKDNPEIFKPGPNLIEFVNRQIFCHKMVIDNAAKNVLNTNQAPGFYAYVGPAVHETTELDKLLRSSYGGRENTLLLKNMYCGYGTAIKGRASNLEEVALSKDEGDKAAAVKNFADSLVSFTYFDSIFQNKIKQREHFTRFKDTDLDTFVEADDKRKVSAFVEETQGFLYEFSKAFAAKIGDPELESLARTLFKLNVSTDLQEQELKFRNKLSSALKKYGATNLPELARLARETSSKMKGLSGATLSKEEAEKKNAS